MVIRPLRKGDTVKYVGHHSKCKNSKCGGIIIHNRIEKLYKVIGRAWDGGIKLQKIDGSHATACWPEHLKRIDYVVKATAKG